MVVVTEDSHVFADIPTSSKSSEIVRLLKQRTGKNYLLYHLGQRLSKNEIVQLEDSEDFVLALAEPQEQIAPMINTGDEEQVRQELRRRSISIPPIEDERDDGENPNHIDKLVFHNGRPLKFEYMQERPPATSVIDAHTRHFVREYVGNDDFREQILPLEDKEAEVVSRNFEAVLEQLLL